MASRHIHEWTKVQEIGPAGKFSLLGDGSVRFVGPTLAHVVRDVAMQVRSPAISDVILGPADAAGWREARQQEYSWAFHVRRPRAHALPAGVAVRVILIGLLQPPAALDPLSGLRSCLTPGARLLVVGLTVTPARHAPTSFNGYDRGFTGGVFVAT